LPHDRPPPIREGLAVIRALEKGGFEVVRSAGSHRRLVHKEDPSRATTVPLHKGRDLPRPMLRAIIKQAGLTVEEFLDLL
jgi:predicted RNA binding protein YcfA (HicA-like mRNA interferase family)